MRVLAMPAKDDMSSLLRVRWPAEELARQGADVVIGDRPWLVREQAAAVSDVEDIDCDVVVLCRPQHRAIVQSIPFLQSRGVAVVVDYDDDLTAVHKHNVAWKAHNPDDEPESNWRWALEACALADLVTVSTPHLLDVYAAHGRGVVLPNRLPSWRIPPRPRHDGSARLGWAGFIGTHPSDLLCLDGAATKVLGRVRPFHVVGPINGDISRQLGGCVVKATGLVDKDAWLPTIAATLDVGIAPAERSAFNLGKSCLKSIEGAAAGVAMVASPTPDNRRAAADGLCVLAEDRRQWERKMRLFLDNDVARAEQVGRASEGLTRHLLEPNAGDWWDAWSIAASGRSASVSFSAMTERAAQPADDVDYAAALARARDDEADRAEVAAVLAAVRKVDA